MSKARVVALVLVVALFGAAAFALSREGRFGPRSDKSELLLLTSLPLVFSEDFSLEQKGSPMLAALRSRYRVVPIDVTDPASLAKGRLLMMAQPRAQTADNLVALDRWVRGGGHVLLLADPALDWPSSKPLTDPTRAPPMYPDTGLLAHWGLRLDSPDRRGPAAGTISGRAVLTISPGTLSGDCAISDRGLVARCPLGKGKATIIADADLLDSTVLGAQAAGNDRAILAELDSLEW